MTLPGQSGGDPYWAIDYAEVSTVTVTSCLGDVNIDGVVDITDILELLGAWGPCPDPCQPECRADLIENGIIAVDDLLAMLASWGPCSP